VIGVELVLKDLKRCVAGVFYVDKVITCLTHGSQQLIKLEVYGLGVPVLGVLNEYHHKEGDDGGAGVNDELPGV